MNRRIHKYILALFVFALVLALPGGDAAHIAEAKKVSSSKKSKKSKKKKKKKTAIVLNKKRLTLRTGSSARLKVKRVKGKQKIKWSSSNTAVATVKGYGKYYATVTGRSVGTATITAKVAGKKLRCSVTVSATAKPSVDYSWSCGTWSKEDCYYNGSGVLLADFEEAMSKPVAIREKLKSYPYFYIGASRTRNTAKAVKDKKVYFYYCGGAGFKWLFHSKEKYGGVRQPAFDMIRSYLHQRPAGTVIIDLGGNDLDNIEAYIGFYRTLLKRFPRATFWFMGVLPREKGDPSNSKRKAFNDRLAKELPGHVINLYSKVYHMDGFKTKDGTHYYKLQSRKIYQMAMKKIGRSIKVDLKTGKVKNKK